MVQGRRSIGGKEVAEILGVVLQIRSMSMAGRRPTRSEK